MSKQELVIEPMTRIEGHLGIQAVADLEKKQYVDAHSFVTMFRGWELILRNREPADAPWLTQRVCGVCPVPHGIASVQAVDMVYNAPPPPLGVVIRNMAFGAEQLYDSCIGTVVLEGPDYSQSIVEKYNPDWWAEAKKRKAPQSDVHGYAKISDIMTALNPISGGLWLRSLHLQKMGRKMAAILGAKHPHINTLIPGGMSLTVTPTEIEQYASILSQHVAFSKELIPIMDDLLDFVLDLGYEKSGKRDFNCVSYGAYDDPYEYDAQYEHLGNWGLKRSISPGVILGGELVTQDLVEIQCGVRQFVDRSFFREWKGLDVKTDPINNPIDNNHPWNKETIPEPGPMKVWDKKYSWAWSPRWLDWKKRKDGKMHMLEAGPIARFWITAVSKKVPEATGTSLKWTLPKAAVAGFPVSEETEFEWKIPNGINTIERVRARAYYYAWSTYEMYRQVLKSMQLIKEGKAKIWNRYQKPNDRLGVGMIDAMRGSLAHWVVMRNKHIANYQIMTPSSWNACPRLSDDDLGPYESAIIGTPITEKLIDGKLSGVDVVRTVRSFDPCIACCVHIYKGDEEIKVIPEI